MEILNCLKKFSVVESFILQDFKVFKGGFYVKIVVILRDSSRLFIREYVDEKERNYSYHWQDKNGNLIVRWDNAPHHKQIKTYPHHKHEKGKVKESFEITCEKILTEITKRLRK